MRVYLLSFFAVLGIVFLFSGEIRAQEYTFTTIADSTGSFKSFYLRPAINNAGQVVLSATFDDSSYVDILVGDGEQLAVMATTASGFSKFYNQQSLNNQGQVALYGYSSSDGVGIFSTDGQLVTAIATINTCFGGYDTYDPPSINDQGVVAFFGTPRSCSGLGPKGIFTGTGGAITIIANTDNGFSAFSGQVSINNVGQVAFRAGLSTGGGGLFRANGDGTFTTMVDNLGSFSGFGDPSLNDSGIVACQASYDSGDSGVITSDGTTLTVMADSSGPFNTFLDTATINNDGDVAFLAVLDT